MFLVLSSNLIYALIGYPDGPVFLALAIAFVYNIVRGNRTAGIVALVLGWTGFVWIGPMVNDGSILPVGGILGVTAWMLVLFAGAEFARSARLRAREEGRSRREESRRKAGEQRMRIARELHDVLAHNISLINVQAGVALHLMDDDPGQARAALTAIREASDETLREVRSVLDILRDGEESAPRTPAPGLNDIEALIDRSSQAGFRVTKRVEGEPRPVPPDVGLAGLRIVQEALTNAARHSGSDRAVVELRYTPHELQLTIEDEGVGVDVPREKGNGINGMTERANSLGGRLIAGLRPGGGFRVQAFLPLPKVPR
jgi:signal transduction histidine kinase